MKKQNKILVAILCVAAGIIVSIGSVWLAGRIFHFAKISHNKAKSKDSEYVQMQMMDYLENRYNEKFTMKAYYPMGYSYNCYVSMEAWPKGKEDDEHEFEVQGYLNDEGNLDYYDTYVCVRLEKEFLEYFDSVIQEFFAESWKDIFFFGEWIRRNVPADVSVEELLAFDSGIDYPMPTIQIGINPKQKYDLKTAEECCRAFQAKNFRGAVEISIVDEKIFQEFMEGNYQNRHSDGVEAHTFFVYNDRIEGMEDKITWN